MGVAPPELVMRCEDGVQLPTLVWRLPAVARCVSTASVGGGLSDCAWVVNAQVASGYQRCDLDTHGAQIAAALELAGPGVVMFTAVDVRRHHTTRVNGVSVTATVGVTDPTWAVDPAGEPPTVPPGPAPTGTVNVVVSLPEPVAPGGLVNLIATVTEAKAQVFADLEVPGTGTPSDAVTVVCPLAGRADPFGGPRSLWGGRAARAAYQAIAAGLRAGRDHEPAPC